MSWQAIAEKDFQDSIRSYWLWGLSSIFITLLAIPPALIVFDIIQITPAEGDESVITDIFILVMEQTMTVVVPIIAIVVAYAAIAGERDSGSLKLLLSLPHSRLDVVIGKVIGRGIVVILPVLIGFVVSALVFALTPIPLAYESYGFFALLTALLALVFVAIAVGVSAAAQTSRRAMIGTVTIYVIFTLLWNQFTDGVVTLLRDHAGLGMDSIVPVHLFLNLLNPTQAYESFLASRFTETTVQARVQIIGSGGLEGQMRQVSYADTLGETVPVYLSDPAVFLLLISWIVIAPVLGYLIFNDADL